MADLPETPEPRLTEPQRKALERERKRALGLVEYRTWIPDTREAREAMAALAKKLRKER